MRKTVSNHTETIRARASQVWPRYSGKNFRPNLNIKLFASLLHIAVDEAMSGKQGPPGKGQKREASSPPVSGPTKRTKTASSSALPARSNTPPMKDTTDFKWPQLGYPHLLLEDEAFRDTDRVPVFQHVFEIQYTTAEPLESEDQNDSLMKPWDEEERNLNEILDSLRASLMQPRTIDLGNVEFIEHYGRLVAASKILRKVSKSTDYLLLVPSYLGEVDLEEFDFSSPSAEDVMLACHVLKSVHRVTIDARLKVVLLPSGAYDEAQYELPFRFQIEINISLIVPAMFESLPKKTTKKKLVEVEDAHRRLFQFIYPHDFATPSSFNGITNIPFLYSILHPAPALPTMCADTAMQPKQLLPTLLPFQRRSVAWLLSREGMDVTPDGKIVPRVSPQEFTFWDRIEEGNHTWYYNRLSGTLSPTPPPVFPVLGGILAEEPGLGKTLETISLILLNPAPEERNPTLTRWDPEARLEVKAIKVSDNLFPPTPLGLPIGQCE